MADYYLLILKHRSTTGSIDCGVHYSTLSDARKLAISELKKYGWSTYYAVLYQQYCPPYYNEVAIGTVQLYNFGYPTPKLRAIWTPKKDSKYKQYFINKNGSLGKGEW